MIIFLQVSELIRQNKPVYAIDTADTETHFKRCFQSSIWVLLSSGCLCREIFFKKMCMGEFTIHKYYKFAKNCTGWKYPCLQGVGYV